jgi:hypothetical protein
MAQSQEITNWRSCFDRRGRTSKDTSTGSVWAKLKNEVERKVEREMGESATGTFI